MGNRRWICGLLDQSSCPRCNLPCQTADTGGRSVGPGHQQCEHSTGRMGSPQHLKAFHFRYDLKDVELNEQFLNAMYIGDIEDSVMAELLPVATSPADRLV